MSQEDASNILTDRIGELTCTNCRGVIDVSQSAPFSEFNCPSCDTPLTVPAKLGPFRLLRMLGAGGMGAIYHGVDEALGRHVAVKVMLKDLGEDPEVVETFTREAKMLAAMNHPNIVQIYNFGEEKGQPYIVMELVTGKGLDHMMAKGKPLNQTLVMQMAVDVATGLKAANDIGLIHGDIKPENVILDVKGTAKVVDFGLATFAEKQADTSGIWGTPYYIAPEKIKRKPVDARSDIYSLGATLFHALTLHPPFEGETAIEIVKARIGHVAPQVLKYREDCLPGVVNIIARMLQEEPARRYPNYSSLIGDLQPAVEELKKRNSGPLEPGKRVVTQRSKKVARTAPDADGDSASSSGKLTKVVLKKQKKSIHLSRPDDDGTEYEPAKQSNADKRRATIIALGAIVTVAALAGIGIFVVDRAKRGKLVKQTMAIVADMQTQRDTFAEATVTPKKTARGLYSRIRLAVRRFRKEPRAEKIRAEAEAMIKETLVRASGLDDKLNELDYFIETATPSAVAGNAKRAENQYNSAVKQKKLLVSGIEKGTWLIELVNDEIKKAYAHFELAEKVLADPTFQLPEPEADGAMPSTDAPPATNAPAAVTPAPPGPDAV